MEVRKELEVVMKEGLDLFDACNVLKSAYCDLLVIRITTLCIDDDDIKRYINVIREINDIKENIYKGGI